MEGKRKEVEEKDGRESGKGKASPDGSHASKGSTWEKGRRKVPSLVPTNSARKGKKGWKERPAHGSHERDGEARNLGL
jgi:hypothetical protein